ncbi:MASE1 domain-containing protein, partial [Candidatus Sumerlaeota bacterium]|nr:MASE1 domain-containing protein [Candidatus Sumerlaeota bacterium]
MRTDRKIPPAVGVCLAYFLAGKIGLVLAIDPGYASAVWPPAGIALGAALLLGRAAYPGIWLGSFLANAIQPFGSNEIPVAVRYLIIPALIGVGATMEAALGARLVHALREPFPILESVRSVVVLLIMGGPVSCLVNSTWAVSALTLTGVVPWRHFGIHWWTWWLGDANGVVLTAPLLLVL